MSKQKADLSGGYTRIANSILKSLYSCPMINREARIILFIIYQTYGYGHKERNLSSSYIGQGTGISQNHVCEIIKKLVSAKIIKQTVDGKSKTQILGINTILKEWVSTPKNRSIKSTPENGSTDTPKNGSTDTPENGIQYNKDITRKNMCVGENPPRHTFEDFSTFDSLWEDWKFSRAGKDKISKAQKNKIIEIGYDRMTEARKKYEAEFAARTSKNNVPLSARSWFGGAYEQYVIVEKMSSGYYRNELGQLVDGMTGEIYE